MRVALYLRVSTGHQTTEMQRRDLEERAKAAGWNIVGVYEDAGISGAKGRDKRPQLDAMLKDATRRKFDMVAAWSLDRLGRSLVHLLTSLKELEGAGVHLYLHKQAIDTSTSMGRLFFSVVGAFAEFERDVARERIQAGVANARAKGKRLGRPTVGADAEAKVRDMLAQGVGQLKTAKTLGVGVSVVRRVAAQMQQARA